MDAGVASGGAQAEAVASVPSNLVAVFRHSPTSMRASFSGGLAAQWDQPADQGDTPQGFRAVLDQNLRTVALVERSGDDWVAIAAMPARDGALYTTHVKSPRLPLKASSFLDAMGEAAAAVEDGSLEPLGPQLRRLRAEYTDSLRQPRA